MHKSTTAEDKELPLYLIIIREAFITVAFTPLYVKDPIKGCKLFDAAEDDYHMLFDYHLIL